MSAETWEIIDHACRHCMGRLVQRENDSGDTITRCCECGASEVGEHDALCWCGVEVREEKAFECFRNLNQSMSAPQEILVRERPRVQAPKREAPRRLNPVVVNGLT